MQTRIFNSISVDHKNAIFTKSSYNTEKLQNEILYYLQLPKKLSQFFPRLINYEKDYSAYKLEYFPYASLEELILNKKISLVEGNEILEALFLILEEIHIIKPKLITISTSDIANFYIKKTKDRVESLKKNAEFKKFLGEPYLKINGRHYKNFFLLENDFSKLINKLTKKHHSISAIHGDFCFSNILRSPTKKIIKLIDPRGSFTEKGIYGHNLYDYAKLMHCLHGRYDHIVNNNFIFYESDTKHFYYQVPTSSLINELHDSYILMLQDKNINLEFLYLIEASLFLSMASLHSENIERQKVIYLTGIIFLNQVIEGRYANLY